jgi:hypothetical protein
MQKHNQTDQEVVVCYNHQGHSLFRKIISSTAGLTCEEAPVFVVQRFCQSCRRLVDPLTVLTLIVTVLNTAAALAAVFRLMREFFPEQQHARRQHEQATTHMPYAPSHGFIV